MAWTAPSHDLNQCWNIVNWTHGNKFSEIVIEIYTFCKEYAFENVIWKMATSLSRPQFVNEVVAARTRLCYGPIIIFDARTCFSIWCLMSEKLPIPYHHRGMKLNRVSINNHNMAYDDDGCAVSDNTGVHLVRWQLNLCMLHRYALITHKNINTAVKQWVGPGYDGPCSPVELLIMHLSAIILKKNTQKNFTFNRHRKCCSTRKRHLVQKHLNKSILYVTG